MGFLPSGRLGCVEMVGRRSRGAFWTQTQRLKGKAKLGHHGLIWEALPAMGYLLKHLEQLEARTPQLEPRLREYVNNAWSKATKYYELTDKRSSDLHRRNFP